MASERWRSPAARDLARAVRAAGGQVERLGSGKLRITGPSGAVTIQEPAEESRRDLRRNSAVKLVTEKTGLNLTN